MAARKPDLFDATVHSRYRVTIPVDALALVTWLNELATGDKVTVEALEPGRAWIRPHSVIQQAYSSAATTSDPQNAADDLDAFLSEGSWSIAKNDGTKSVTLTRLLALHVLENGEVEGLVYASAKFQRLELWSDTCRTRMISRARQRRADLIPD